MEQEWRTERDGMGEVRVPAGRYWGAQTQRSLDNFRIGPPGSMPNELIRAYGYQKKASALANLALGELGHEKAEAIARVCDEIIAGRLDDHFPLVIWQTGSGTQTNMNLNEVISNRAAELFPDLPRLHPNDDVNRSQSSNDTFPTAMHIAARLMLDQSTLPGLHALHRAIEDLAGRTMRVLKAGRTHWMDAVPITFGQELSGYASQIDGAITAIGRSLRRLELLALGATAVGTGLNAPAGYAEKAAAVIADITCLPFSTAPNKFEALAAHDAIVEAHGALRLAAVALLKITGDFRAMASGPRCGLGEITMPQHEPGSSIMPGKTNPTQAEALAMVCARVMGNDVTIAVAGSSGQFELNVCKPVLISAFLESASLLGDACRSFAERCVAGIIPDVEKMNAYASSTPMLATALAPHIGYDQAAAIARTAMAQGISIREAAIVSGAVKSDEYDRWVDPARMAGL